MILSTEYLNERHRYWIARIASAGIWDARKFRPVTILLRRHAKSYMGLFQRKTTKSGLFRRHTADFIIIYQQSEDIDPRTIDETLVHEMIHQYIIQNKLRDTTSHGSLFRDFMTRINHTFPDELTISIRRKIKPKEGEGEKNHTLLILYKENGECFCCKLNPKKAGWFISEIERHKNDSQISSYCLCTSRDMYFNSFSACTRRLHGVRIPFADLDEFCRHYGVKISNQSSEIRVQ